MSGIFGLYHSQTGIEITVLDRCLASLKPGSESLNQLEYVKTPRLILGRTHLRVFSQPPMAASPVAPPVLVSSGYCAGESGHGLGWSEENLRTLQRLLDRDDRDGLARLNGTFQCAYLSADGRTLKLVNDRFGLMPLFIFEHAPLFAFAPDLTLLLTLIRAFIPDGKFDLALDRAALAEWFEIGLVMGNRTLLRDVTMMPPASVRTWVGQRSVIGRYWRPRFCEENHPFDTTERGEAFDTALRWSLKRRMPPAKRTSISLSGGLDSRLLIGASVREGLPVSVLTFGPEHSSDHAIASAVSEFLDIPHHRFFDQPDNSAAFFDLGIRRTSGMANVLDLWGLQHGPAIHETADILLNGIGGNELLGFLAFDLLRFKIPRSTAYLTHWLLRKLNPGWSASDRALIRRTLAPNETPVSERIDSFWSDCPAHSPMARVYHFYLEEKSRKSNALGVATDDLFVEPVAPFLDNDVVDIALQMPPRQRLLARFYREFFRTHYPELAAIPYSRTGLPVSTSEGRLFVNKLARRLSGGKDDSPSAWTRWLRRDLAAMVHEKLLDQSISTVNVLPTEIARGRVDALMAGAASATMPIGQLLSLESFLRQFKPSV